MKVTRPTVVEAMKYEGVVGVVPMNGATPRNAEVEEAVHDTSRRVPVNGDVTNGTYPAEVVAVHVVVVAVERLKYLHGDILPRYCSEVVAVVVAPRNTSPEMIALPCTESVLMGEVEAILTLDETYRFVEVAYVVVPVTAVNPPVNVVEAVHTFAEVRLSPIVLAVAPLYVPEKVRVLSVAVRLARDTSPDDTVAQVAPPTASSERTN